MNVSAYKKTIAAVVGAVLTWGVTAQPGGIDGAEWWGLGVAVATALGVYQARNIAPLARDDDGQSGLNALMSVIAAVIMLAFAVWLLRFLFDAGGAG